MTANLYVVAYDIRDQKRLKQMRSLMRHYFHSAQRSVFECVLEATSVEDLLSEAEACMDLTTDCFCLSRIDVPEPGLQTLQSPERFNLNYRYFG